MSDITFEYVTDPGDSITFELTDTVTLPPGGGGGTSDHRDLTNRDDPDQHPTSAITGLDAALAGKETAGAAATAQAYAVQRANHTGTQSADSLTDGTTNKAYTGAEQSKLAGIAAGATANQSDATTNAAIALKADLASPAFTGTPAAPTQAPGNNSTRLSTTAFVTAAVGGGIFGDGSDGAVTISSNTTITRDMFYASLTINSGVTLTARGFRIFVNGTLTNNGTISADGNSASGTSQGDGNIGTLNSPGGGQLAQTGAGANAAAVSASLGGSGGAGGAGSGGAGGTGGAANAPTAAQGSPRTLPFCTTLVLTHAAGSTAIRGGGGGGSGGGDGGASGAGASGGHPLVLAARILVNNGVIRSNGGTGGNAPSGNRGGGGGGGGGPIFLTYVTKSGSGSTSVLGGAGGTGSGTGVPGSSGSAGNVFEVACV